VASGQQWNLAADGHEATVVEVGGGVREYSVDGVPQLLGYAPDQVAPGSAGALLVPWPNRIRDGRYTFDGADGSCRSPSRRSTTPVTACSAGRTGTPSGRPPTP
jgi:hypothetical protein